jgi:hypothetical protein
MATAKPKLRALAEDRIPMLSNPAGIGHGRRKCPSLQPRYHPTSDASSMAQHGLTACESRRELGERGGRVEKGNIYGRKRGKGKKKRWTKGTCTSALTHITGIPC